jgi:hypothetical protein
MASNKKTKFFENEGKWNKTNPLPTRVVMQLQSGILPYKSNGSLGGGVPWLPSICKPVMEVKDFFCFDKMMSMDLVMVYENDDASFKCTKVEIINKDLHYCERLFL